jgi:hypothetical protein
MSTRSLRVPGVLLLAAALGAQVPDPATRTPQRQGEAARQEEAHAQRPADASELFREMAKVTGLEASFEEEKHLALLAVPLRCKGRLFFLRDERGGFLARHVEEPEKSSVVITPDELRLQDLDGTEVIDLRRSDKVRAFITSLVLVFSGDEQALARVFDVRFEHAKDSATGWTLTLTPRPQKDEKTSLDKMLKELRLTGDGRAVMRIEVVDPTGDRTVTRILATDPARRFDAADKKRLFGIDGE